MPKLYESDESLIKVDIPKLVGDIIAKGYTAHEFSKDIPLADPVWQFVDGKWMCPKYGTGSLSCIHRELMYLFMRLFAMAEGVQKCIDDSKEFGKEYVKGVAADMVMMLLKPILGKGEPIKVGE